MINKKEKKKLDEKRIENAERTLAEMLGITPEEFRNEQKKYIRHINSERGGSC